MNPRKLSIEDFYNLPPGIPVIDVRSPSEYLSGHIPGAVNVPLFSDEERKQVGTLYKNSGKEAAVYLGLDITGPRMSFFLKALKRSIHGKQAVLHCWRGGRRSAAMAFLCSLADYDTLIIDGGYKAYRKFIRNRFAQEAKIVVLSGKTGSGKTEILHHLEGMGEQVIDLEGLARHKGSVFGHLGQECQPSNEQFENNLFEVWRRIDFTRPVWIENESRSIGSVSIPDPLFLKMMQSPALNIELSFDLRHRRLVREYGGYGRDRLSSAVMKIGKRLGGHETRLCLDALAKGDVLQAVSLVLSYYDKTYVKGLNERKPQSWIHLELAHDNAEMNARRILDAYRKSDL
ncbi:MAG: tRNA 2-selenouridine(34) synthase MnmH [Bacteroidales bacterium]|nr:tRNA 2-selenouridine(34) synthase MnmH [Bacteroidales bacterium]